MPALRNRFRLGVRPTGRRRGQLVEVVAVLKPAWLNDDADCARETKNVVVLLRRIEITVSRPQISNRSIPGAASVHSRSPRDRARRVCLRDALVGSIAIVNPLPVVSAHVPASVIA